MSDPLRLVDDYPLYIGGDWVEPRSGRYDDVSPATEETIARAFDEINEFEAQQRDYGTLLLKLYFTVDAEVQERRLAERAKSAWRNISDRNEGIFVGDPGYSRAFDDLMAHSNTRWSPWRKIDGNDEAAASIVTLEAIADAWSSAMPSEPPHLVGASGRVA